MNYFRRFVPFKLITAITIIACFVTFTWQSVMAANNTATVFSTSATDLSVSGNYSPSITPTSAAGFDVQFSGSYGATQFTINGASLLFGTLDDLDTTQNIVITNTSSTAGTIELDSTNSNGTSGAAGSDLLYVKSGANLTIQSGAGTTTVNLGLSGKFDNAGTLLINAPITLSGHTLTFTGTGATTISGIISSGSGNLTVNDTTGSVTLSGANTYGGTTTITSGTLILDQTSGTTQALNAATAGGGFAGNLVVATAITVDFNSGIFSGGGQIQVQTTGTTLTDASSSSAITLSNVISLNSTGTAFTAGNVAAAAYTPGTFVTTLGGTGSSSPALTFSGVISGNSDLMIANSTAGGGAGLVVLGLAGTGGGVGGYETYAGNTVFNGNGIVTLASSNVLPTSTDVIDSTVSGGGASTLNLNGFNQQIGSISDGAFSTSTAHTLTITNNPATNPTTSPATLTIGDSITPANGFTGAIKDGTSTLALVKTGTDSITLSGNNNAFSGGVTVNQGTLTGSGTNALGTGSVTVNPTGTTGTTADAAILSTNTSAIGNSAAVFTVNTISATEIGTIDFTSGAPKIGSLNGNGNVGLQNSGGTALTIGNTSNNLSSTFSGVISEAHTGEGSIIVAGTGTLTLSGTNTYTGTTTVNSGSTLILAQVSATQTLYAATAGGGFAGNLVVANGIRVNFNGGAFSGGGLIQVQTTGATLTDSGSQSAAVTVGNAIALNSNNTAFTQGTFAATTYTPGSFVTALGGTTSGSPAITFSGIISGNSDLTISNSASGGGGGGPVTLGLAGTAGGASGYETYTGNTIFNGNGTVTLASSNILPTSTNVIEGTAGIGAPTLILNGFSQQIGSISDGSAVTSVKYLTIENNGASPATLTVGNATTPLTSFSGAIVDGSGGGTLALVKSLANTVGLAGTNTYSGGTMVTGGTLVVDGSISGSTLVQNTGTLGGKGTAGSVEVKSGGTLQPGLEMSGSTMGTLTASGLIWDSGGTLTLQLSTTTDASALLSLGSGSLGEGVPGGPFQFNFLGGGEAGQTYDLINFGSTSFANALAFSAANLGAGLSANFTLSSNQLDVQLLAVPEPSAWGALAWGVGILVGFRRFRQRSRSV